MRLAISCFADRSFRTKGGRVPTDTVSALWTPQLAPPSASPTPSPQAGPPGPSMPELLHYSQGWDMEDSGPSTCDPVLNVPFNTNSCAMRWSLGL